MHPEATGLFFLKNNIRVQRILLMLMPYQIFFIAALLCVVLLLVLCSLFRSGVDGVREWSVANMLGAVAYFLYAFGSELPPVIAYDGANAIYIASSAAMLIGFRRFFGRAVPWAWLSVGGMATIVWSVIFHHYHDSFTMRTLGVSVFQSLFGFAVVITIVRAAPRPLRYPALFTGSMAALVAAGHSVRGIVYAAGAVEQSSVLQPSAINVIFLSAGAVVFPMLTFGAVMLVHDQMIWRTRERANTLRRQASLLEMARDAIIVRDMNGVILFWNKGAQELYGWSSEEAVGQLKYRLLKTEFPVPIERFRAALLQTGYWEGEMRHSNRDGKAITVASRHFLQRDKDGQPIVVLDISTNITEYKAAHLQLQDATEAAQEASRAKSEFLANMSHELRTPMNGVIGLTDLLLKSPLSTRQREYLMLIKSSADSLLRLLNDILDFSKLEARKLDLEVVEFDPRESIGNMFKAFSVSAIEKELELMYRIDPAVPAKLLGDPGRLSQIIINLVGNAVKFTDEGEVVFRMDVEAEHAGSIVLHCSVTDTGPGIAEDKREQIFNAFEQADSSTTRVYGGTGLGLSIVAQLVALMHGRAWADNNVGGGATFHFTVRLGLPDRTCEPFFMPGLAGLHGRTVLIVDDNGTHRSILAELVEGWGLVPVPAESAEQAMAQLRRKEAGAAPFALALIDAQMPLQRDGFWLVEAMKSEPEFDMPVIMMLSSRDVSGDIARGTQLAIARYLMKPVKPSELLDSFLAATELRRTPRIAPAPQANDGRPPRRLNVLVAEDHPVNQKLVEEILRERGHSVWIAKTGAEAVRMFEGQSFDVILMDGQMPEMDGYQAAMEIRRRERASGSRVRIIAVTADARNEDRKMCLAAGMDDYISKPIDPEQLLQRLESAPD
ncbi:MAG: rpfC [Noviherbaspirillum sp.]|nr:rpfC [Noviherbaspirillum sp.]